MSAALIGSGVGLSLGAAYLAGGMAQHAQDHSRAERIAEAAAGGYSLSAVQQDASPTVLKLTRAHDPFAMAAERPNDLAARLRGAAEAKPKRVSELECLTQAVYYEARGETPQGQAAVAQVVMNRVRHPAFPKTVCGVVFQGAKGRGCQFSFACDGSMRRSREASAWKRARKIAARAMSGVVSAEVGAATHFHTTAVNPAWGAQMRRVAQVGMHVFYRFSPRKALQPQFAPAVVEHAVMTAAATASQPDLRVSAALSEAQDAAAKPAAKPVADAPAAGSAPAPAPPQPSEAKPAAPQPQPADTAALKPAATDAVAGT